MLHEKWKRKRLAKAKLETESPTEQERYTDAQSEQYATLEPKNFASQTSVGISLSTPTKKKSESIWKFGKQEIWQGVIGALVNALLSQVHYGLTTALLIFFGISYGPWVGLIVGLIGGALSYLLFSLRTGEPIFSLSIFVGGFVGMIVGLTIRKFQNFRDPRTIFKAIGLYLLVSISFIIFNSILVYLEGYYLGYSSFYSSAITNWVIGSIFLAITMIASAKLVRPTPTSE